MGNLHGLRHLSVHVKKSTVVLNCGKSFVVAPFLLRVLQSVGFSFTDFFSFFNLSRFLKELYGELICFTFAFALSIDGDCLFRLFGPVLFSSTLICFPLLLIVSLI